MKNYQQTVIAPGITGEGKTFNMKEIIAELKNRNIPLQVIDGEGDSRKGAPLSRYMPSLDIPVIEPPFMVQKQ
jgi:hypothetical protein